MELYQPGESVIRYCNIFPAKITPWVDPLPVNSRGEAQSVMMRAVVTTRFLTLGYQWGQDVKRIDIEIDPDEAATVSLGGGTVGGWTIGRGTGCRCNARLLQGWEPWPEVNYQDPATLVDSPRDSTWGLVPARYSRPW